MSTGSDTDNLAKINKLNQAIAERESLRKAAQADLVKANKKATDRQGAVKTIEAQTTALGAEVHGHYSTVYLNGRSLDRGTARVGNEVLRFNGWYGNTEVTLAAITRFELGTSNLPPRAGVPLLDKVWPGTPRAAATLLLTIHENNSNHTNLIVLADLSNSTEFQVKIQDRIVKLGEVASRRAEHNSQREGALAALAEATEGIKQASAHVAALEAEISPYRTQRDFLIKLQDELDELRKARATAELGSTKKSGKRK